MRYKKQKNILKRWKEEEFDTIFNRIANKKYQINSSEYLDDGKFPVVDQGKNKIVAYSNKEDKVFKNNSIILFGDHTRIIKYINFDFVVGADGTQLIRTREGYSNKFFYYSLLNKKIPNTGYNRHFKFLKEGIFLAPPILEQNRIVGVLECWDGYLEKLGRKIELKKNIKKGLMQQLLTGRKRLVGFKKVCKKIQLGKLLDYEQPTNYIVRSTEYNDENITPVLTAGKTFILGYTYEEDGIFETNKLPVIIFDDFTTANKFVNFPFKVKSSAMKILKNKDDNASNINFIFESIQLLKFKVGEHKRNYLSEYQYLDIRFPEIEEQKAIADILTKADDEIEALEKKRWIIEAQKKYLLNNLVTGKILTPETI